ncbi:flagellar biosynthetic protein FliO [Lysinibacillus sp. LZ02]|uniref:flagellar biosynthetic protein FliO n=1 Tax=Lysinibacillus sp. LZ02 TaxID=3420668 RepID=UPI003D361026
MQVKKSFYVRMVFVLLLMFVALTHVTSTSYAMVSDESLKNPSLYVDSDETDADTENSDSASVRMGPWEYIRILLSLVFVLGLLIYVLRFLNKRNQNYQQNSMVRNLGGHSVGPQKSVQLLQIGNQIYVVGVGEDVRLLQTISDPQEIEQIVELYNEKYKNTSTAPYIAELFTKFKPQRSAKVQAEEFNSILDKRLSEIKKERSDGLERWKEKGNDKQ